MNQQVPCTATETTLQLVSGGRSHERTIVLSSHVPNFHEDQKEHLYLPIYTQLTIT